MILRKRFATLILALVLALSLAACGKAAPAEETAPAEEVQPVAGTDVLIAHGGGALYGYKITNSLEAINSAYDRGFRYIELDFELTTDDHVVLIHGWESMVQRFLNKNGQLSYDEFMNAETFQGMTLMDLDMLVDWLGEHGDCRIITDAKEENEKILAMIAEHEDVRAQFIPQIYSYEEFEPVKAMGYGDIIITLYRMTVQIDDLSDFLANNDVWGLTVPQELVSEDFLDTVSKLAPRVYTHSINELWYFETWHAHGLYGIYTDYFEPEHWPYC